MKIKNVSLLLLLCTILVQGCTRESTDIHPTQDNPPLISQPSPVAPTKISNVVTEVPVITEVQKEENGPLAVVQSFYDWYLSQPQGEVLSKRTYESSDYLSDIAKSDFGYLLDSFVDRAGYDPFTCAQTILPSLMFDPVFISGGEANVIANVVQDGEILHYFVVQVGQGEGDWKIDSIRCPFDPQTTVIAFYTWYLGTIFHGEDATVGIDNPRNPIAEGLLDNSHFISAQFKEKINKRIQDMQSLGSVSDPILSAQSFPTHFWVAPGQEGNTITAQLTYGPQSTKYSIVHLVESKKLYWVIDNIEQEEIPTFDPFANMDINTSDWNLFESEQFQFSFKYPSNWKTKPSDLSSLPPGDPLKESVFFLADWADPEMPIMWLQIINGSEAQLNNYFVTENRQVTKLSNQRVWVDRDRCEQRFVFKHPNLDDVWLVIGDTCSSLPGREQYAEEIQKVLSPLLRTIAFP